MIWKYQFPGSPPYELAEDYSEGGMAFWHTEWDYGFSITIPSPTNDIWIKFDSPADSGVRVSVNLGNYQTGRYDENNHGDYDNSLDCIINTLEIRNTVHRPSEFFINQDIGGDWSGWYTPTDTNVTSIVHFSRKDDCYLAELWEDEQLIASYEFPRINDPNAWFYEPAYGRDLLSDSDDFLQISIVSGSSECSNFIISNDTLTFNDIVSSNSFALQLVFSFDLARQPYFDNKRWTICKLKDTRRYSDLPLYLPEPLALYGYEFFVPATKEIWIKSKIKKIVNSASYTGLPRLFISARTKKEPLLLTGLSEINEEFDVWVNSSDKIWSRHSVDSYGKYSHCIIHIISDAENGLVEVIWEDETIIIWQGNVNDGDFFDTFTCYGEGDRFRVYDLIISNKELTFDDKAFETKDIAVFLQRDLGNGELYYRTLDFDTTRNIYRLISVDITFDLERCILPDNTWIIDTLRNIYHPVLLNNDIDCNLIERVNRDADILRNVQKTFELDFDLVKTLPHQITLSAYDDSDNNLDVQSFEIRIGEQQLTDVITYTTISPVNIMEQIKGQYFDYKFNMRVESIKQHGILCTCTCCSDIDEILYRQLSYIVPPDEQWHKTQSNETTSQQQSLTYPFQDIYPDETDDDDDNIPKSPASVHANRVARTLGKQPILRFHDFVSTADVEAGGQTYNDIIRNIFGWTSRIPHKMINCYLRDDNFFVVQRGCEENLIDLSDSIIDIVSVDRELVRTMWGSSVWSKTETRQHVSGTFWAHSGGDDSDKNGPRKQSYDNNSNYQYDNTGLVTSTRTQTSEGYTETTYTYKTLSNGRKVLADETTKVYEKGSLVDVSKTYHTYLDQGQMHSVAISENGDYLGSTVSESTGDARRTPYERGHTDDVWTLTPKYENQSRTLHGITLFDASFPVYGDAALSSITRDIKWLNRRTQETITMNLYNYNHVIDFNDRIIINENLYFLKSNTALQNNRIVNKQTLSLVRWY